MLLLFFKKIVVAPLPPVVNVAWANFGDITRATTALYTTMAKSQANETSVTAQDTQTSVTSQIYKVTA